MPPSITLVAGQVIDSYRIVRKIGAGGMGAVYEATHTVLGQRVAIKILLGDVAENPSLLQRFINEARAASQSNHPGIVRVFDLGRLEGEGEGGVPWLSMEYLDGQSLAERIHAAGRRGGKALGVSELWIIGDIASALAAAHAKGIVHRDLKPGNVMLVADPATLTGERAKVVDFGIAKLLLDADPVTRRGAVLGTPLYMALEQFRDSAEVDGQSDVFSLGVIAYEILTGRRPHNGQTHYEVMGARLMDPIVPVQQLVPSLPDGVAALVMRMLEREPDNRPTMNEVELEVRRLLGLPPPRQSGWHNAVAPTPTPEASNIDSAEPAKPPGFPSFDSNASTPDAPLAVALPSMAATPSSEKAFGERSPPSAVPVPISISSMPSVPVAISPPLRISPEASTAPQSTTHAVPEAVASPSSPTAPERRGRLRMYWLSSLAAVAMAVGGVSLWLRQHQPSAPASLAPVEHPSFPSPPPPQMPPPVAPATPTQPSAPVPTPPPELTATPDKAHPTAKAKCVSRVADAACILTPMLAQQRDEIGAALRDVGIRLCAGERLVIAGLPGRPRLLEQPPRIKNSASNLLLDALRGIEGTLPAKVEIQCK